MYVMVDSQNTQACITYDHQQNYNVFMSSENNSKFSSVDDDMYYSQTP